MHNPLGGQRVGFGPGTQVDQEVFNPLLQVSDKVEYPGGVVIDKDSEDYGHTGKETVLRAGLVLTRIETGANKGKFVPAKHADAEASGDVIEAVILLETVAMEGKDGSVEDKIGVPALLGGTVDNAKVYYDDASYEDAVKAVLPRVSFLTAPA